MSKRPGVLLLIALLVSLAPPLMAASINDTLDGSRLSPGEPDTMTIAVSAEGSVSGVLHVRLQMAGDTVAGGDWVFTSKGGVLRGTVSSASVTAEERRLAAANLALTVTSGAGEYANVQAGSGTVGLQKANDDDNRLFGSLSLTF